MAVSRENAVVGAEVQLRVTWTLDGGQKFDPFELRKVDILDSATGAVVATVGAANIVRLELGVYAVTVGPFAAGGFSDRWYLTPFQGGEEQVKQFRFQVIPAGAGAGDLPFTTAELIANYLFGMNLTDDSGAPFPDSLFEQAIRWSLAFTERALDIDIMPRDYVGAVAERHDYYLPDYIQFCTLKLDHRPLREIVSVKAFYPGSVDSITDFPLEWVQVVIPEAARIELAPSSGTLANFVLGRGGQYLPLIRASGTQRYPGLLRVEYRTGFEAGSIPADILHLLSMRAAANVLNPAGDLVAGAGIATKSISIGGLSQSIATTSSATNAGYGSRLIQYAKEIKAIEPTIRSYYHGPSMHVV